MPESLLAFGIGKTSLAETFCPGTRLRAQQVPQALKLGRKHGGATGHGTAQRERDAGERGAGKGERREGGFIVGI